MKMFHSSIEPLEARVAPATLVGNVLTYTDIDGDLVKVTFTHATMAAGDLTFSTGTANDGVDTPRTLDMINLIGKTGAGLSLVATPKNGKGDSHANVGTIKADYTDLGTVKIDGGVGIVTAGSGDAGSVGLKSFTALSMGQNSSLANPSTIYNAGVFTVRADVFNTGLEFHGSVKSVSIGGNLQTSGVFVTGNLGTLTIGGSLLSFGTQVYVHDGASAGTIKIGGSIDGGELRVDQPLKSLTIGHDLLGQNAASNSGTVRLDNVGTVRIGGSVQGADNTFSSGTVQTKVATSIAIGGSVRSGDFTVNDSFFGNGGVFADRVQTLTIGGDLVAGVNNSGHPTSSTGTISVVGTVGTLTIGGSLVGESNNRALISVGADGTTGPVNAVKTLTVKHSVRYGSLLAGYDVGTPHNLESGFGSITVGGDFRGSFITAGADKGSDGIAGNTDDHTVNTTATLGSVKIGGTFAGIFGSSTPYYIYAPIVKKVTIGKAVYTHDQLAGHPVDFNATGIAGIISSH